MLINSRKFDIRIWVLVTQDHNCHLFKEGYVRMSSYNYTIDNDSISKRAVHLTNIAIQKLDRNYGLKEDGNILSFNQATQITGVDFHGLMRGPIRNSIETSIAAVR